MRRAITVGVLAVVSSALALSAGALNNAPPGPEHVLVVINARSGLSRRIGDYYVRKRLIPQKNVCRIQTTTEEDVSREIYNAEIAGAIRKFLEKRGSYLDLRYVVLTQGVPLRIVHAQQGEHTESAALDSELALLPYDIRYGGHPLAGVLRNPYYGRVREAFETAKFEIFLVTRLAGYRFEDVQGLVDRSLAAVNRGSIVLDLRGNEQGIGNDWLREAARRLPKERVILDETPAVLRNLSPVLGHASWGSNDPNRKERVLGLDWVPGGVLVEFVSTNARTFREPPASWNIGRWGQTDRYFAGAPQTLIGDYIREGVTGVAGNIDEPYLEATPRPEILFPAYLSGRNLAESFYLAQPVLSWVTIFVGDPLCRLSGGTASR